MTEVEVEPSTEIVQRAASVPAELTVDELADQVNKIQAALKRVMQSGTHYGTIPGTDKPTLYKPGAEKLCLLFRLAPEYQVVETHDDDGHYTVRATCRLIHQPTGYFVAAGEGLCTTRESKYAYRKQARICPACGAEAIIKGKAEYGGGWLCFRKKGGCGAKYEDGDAVIESQSEGEVPNEKLADSYNTVLKMACKRALIAGVLNATAASDIFTQDIEDFSDAQKVEREQPKEPQAGSAETLTILMDALENNSDEPKIWSEKVVLANARRHFGRKIEDLRSLTNDEMESIIKSALKWREDNPIIVIEEGE